MTYSDIQGLLASMRPSASSGFISTSGTTSELAFYLRMVNSKLCGKAHRFSWTMREYSLTLTGATDYDLRTLIPDLIEIYQVKGDSVPGYEMGFRDLREYNLSVGGVEFTIMGSTLRIKNGASTGTLVIPYYSNYLVVSNSGTRQLDFSDGDDEWLGPPHLEPMLIEGVLSYFDRKEKEPIFTQKYIMWDGRVADLDPFQILYWDAVQADKQVTKPLYDFRYLM